MLALFCFRSKHERGRFWFRVSTVYRSGERWKCCISEVSWDLGRRFARYLCDKHGIQNRVGLLSGRIFKSKKWRRK